MALPVYSVSHRDLVYKDKQQYTENIQVYFNSVKIGQGNSFILNCLSELVWITFSTNSLEQTNEV